MEREKVLRIRIQALRGGADWRSVIAAQEGA